MAYFPEFRPMRSFILQNIRSDNDRPKMLRWLYKQHVPESISQFMPYCTKYATYHALPVPDGGQDFGTYNAWMTEHYWLFNIFQDKGTGMPRGLAFGEEFPDDFKEMTTSPPGEAPRAGGWQGSREGHHPLVFSFAPIFWEDDFKGEGRLTEGRTALHGALQRLRRDVPPRPAGLRPSTAVARIHHYQVAIA